jgi:hypothetical protein
VLQVSNYSRKPVESPNANPSKIGKGNPGKMPFFSNINKVIIEPTKMPTTAAMVGTTLGKKLKNITPLNIE